MKLRKIVAMFYSIYLIKSGKIEKTIKKCIEKKLIISVYFHNPSKKLFENSVKWFLKKGFQFISVQELYDLLKNKEEIPLKKVIFTVDDGWKENKKNIVDVALKYKIPVTIFATVDPINNGSRFWWSITNEAFEKKAIKENISEIKNLENKERIRLVEKAKLYTKNKIESLNKSELVEIAKNKFISFGSHTINHPILTKCKNETSEYEIKYSKLILENWINEPIISFAYPNGCYDDREIKYLCDNYYKIAFTTKPNYISKANKNNLFEIPRFDVLENVSSYENICRMTGVWFERKINMKLND
jgi:peptidoglycan/xylan/chitin deacetylase (PgdA/CDA1 family)